MKRKFGEIGTGTRFCFRGRRYEKVAPEIGRDEERGGNVFHFHTEVLVEELPHCPAKRRRIVPLTTPPAIPSEPRSRLPGCDQREMIDAGLRSLCPPQERARDGWYGTYSG